MVAGLILAPLPIYANVGPLYELKGSGVVAPESPHNNIRMDSEIVIIRLKSDSYMVEAVFNLFNTGATSTEWIGFPHWVASRTGSFPGFIRFKGSVNGKEITFNPETEHTREPPHSSPTSFPEKSVVGPGGMAEMHQWLVGRVTFPGRAETTIAVTYQAPYAAGYGGWYNESYIYGTGHLWKGEIKEAVFVIDSTALGGTEKNSTHFEQRVGATPVARPLLKNIVTYHLKDFKPHPEAYFRIQTQMSPWDWMKAKVLKQPTDRLGFPRPLVR